MKTFFILGAAAVVALGATPAGAQHAGQCAVWRHGECARWMHAQEPWRVGYVFGPDYAYTNYGTLPQPYVARYHLSPRYRYVYSGSHIYVVDPTTYAVTRIVSAMSR